MIAARSSLPSRLDGVVRRIAVWASFSSPNFSRYHTSTSTRTLNPVLMTGEKGGHTGMGYHKKRKDVLRVWRPMSTQPVSDGVHQEDGSEAGPEPLEIQKNSSFSPTSILLENDSTMATSLASASSSNTPSHDDQAVMEVNASDGSKNKVNINQETGDIMSESDVGSRQEKYSGSIEVGASLIRFIKGKGGSTQKEIEENIGVKLIFPSSKQDTKVVIEGNSEASVTVALERINHILEEAVKSPQLDYSHFISLPLAVHSELVEKLKRFQNSILGDATSSQDGNTDNEFDDVASGDEEVHNAAVKIEIEGKKEHADTTGSKTSAKESILSDMGIDRTIFIKPKTFHLTVLMLKLWNQERVTAAADVLQKISSKVRDALDNRPISIRLRGLTCMRGSPAKARVVYIPVKESRDEGRLLRACQVIIDAFVEAGLVLEKDAQSSLKLHATVINVRHRKRNKNKKVKQFDSFDARHIFRVHGSEDWGEYPIRDIQLSQRFKFDEKGYYHCCASIPLPESI